MREIMVVGSINMDVVMTMKQVPEAGESVYCLKRECNGGGKGANQALALHGLGIPVLFCGAVGQDAYGESILSIYHSAGLDTRYILKKDVHTGTAYILLEEHGENRIIVAPGANECIDLEDVKCIMPLLTHCKYLLLQLEIPLSIIHYLVEEAAKLGVQTIVDAGPIRGCTLELLRGTWCVSPNKSELAALTGQEIHSQADIEKACKTVLDAGVSCVLVKLGKNGSYYQDEKQRFFTPAYEVETVDTTAAGDSFTAGFAAGLWRGLPVRESVELATQCGAIAVTTEGAYPSLPTLEKLKSFCETHGGR